MLNLHVNNATSKYNEEESEENLIYLPRVISDWAKQFSEEYSNENAYFLDGTNTEQDLYDGQRRLYFVDITVGSTDLDEKCFPEQVKGLFLNKRKNEWISRFMGYGIMFLLLSGLSIVMSALQYRRVKRNNFQGTAAAKNISLLPLIMLTAWTL